MGHAFNLQARLAKLTIIRVFCVYRLPVSAQKFLLRDAMDKRLRKYSGLAGAHRICVKLSGGWKG
jgi:hypothetical protein